MISFFSFISDITGDKNIPMFIRGFFFALLAIIGLMGLFGGFSVLWYFLGVSILGIINIFLFLLTGSIIGFWKYLIYYILSNFVIIMFLSMILFKRQEKTNDGLRDI